MTASGGRLSLGLERARLVAEAVDMNLYQLVSGGNFGGRLTVHHNLQLSCQFLQFLGKNCVCALEGEQG